MGKRLTAQHIMDNYQIGNSRSNKTDEEFWADTLETAKTTKVSADKTLFEHITERGQLKPILIGRKSIHSPAEIFDGHHRLAVLHHMNPNQFVKYVRDDPGGSSVDPVGRDNSWDAM